ncbi:hypothetical protein AMTR_s00021p00245210 [Amborella trichopoda]|uniref:Uncharacterized protein n=1 Tax=Amborella trichopoda TaxID=13333 RepID=W1Q133_AMBTC|nr:hypothetical protein AMTR_s00021p00245210 [Amborella trichopoda]
MLLWRAAEMGSKPALTTEAIALTEKKMDMSLDDIIKMSKKPAVKRPRGPIKNRGFPSSASSQAKGSNALFMQSRSSALRQGLLAEKRTNFKNQQFSYAKEAARKSSMTPVRTRVNWNKMRFIHNGVQKFVGGVVPVNMGFCDEYGVYDEYVLKGNANLVSGACNGLDGQGQNFQVRVSLDEADEWAWPLQVTPELVSCIRGAKGEWIAPQLNQRTASEGFSANKERGVQKQKPKTLDSLFAGMKEQRMKKFRATQQQIRGGGRQRLTFPVTQRQQQQRQQSNGGFRPFKLPQTMMYICYI